VPNAKILIVEDEAIEALDIQQRLVALGYPTPEIAHSGEEGVRLAEAMRPDLALMDIMMPGQLDGVAAAARIQAALYIPVVYLTAYADEDTFQRAKVTAPYGYIVKPFQERELQISVDVALYKHAMERRLKEREKWLATTLQSIGDAVVATDAAGRVTFMNPVAEGLTGWTSEEAAARELGEVFRIINATTRLPVESPVVKVLREGITAGLGNHTALVSRNGAEVPIDDSAAPIKEIGRAHV
jgi:PAS domain S-box-containing protein